MDPRARVPYYQQVAVLALAHCSFLLLAAFCRDVARIGRAIVPEIGWP
ncbi:MAG: hypothetical protein R3F40_09355 [Candidatus Competibacteraceae bacterium]